MSPKAWVIVLRRKIREIDWNHRVVQPICIDPPKSISMVLLAASILCLTFLLLGGVVFPGIFLAKFDFADRIRFVTHKNSITFSLYGHCVDEVCMQPSFFNKFDQMPNSDDIQSGGNHKRGLSVP